MSKFIDILEACKCGKSEKDCCKGKCKGKCSCKKEVVKEEVEKNTKGMKYGNLPLDGWEEIDNLVIE